MISGHPGVSLASLPYYCGVRSTYKQTKQPLVLERGVAAYRGSAFLLTAAAAALLLPLQ